jgi:hypothetical protein
MSEPEDARPPREPRRARIINLSVTLAIACALAILAWLAFRSPWRHDPLQVGVWETLIAAEGFTFTDTDPDDGLPGYVLVERGKGRFARRDYVHPLTGARLELRRGYWRGALRDNCTVSARDAAGTDALLRVLERFGPLLRRRCEEARARAVRLGVWQRVNVPDFSCHCHPDTLTVYVGTGETYFGPHFERLLARLAWRVRRLTGRD